MTWLVTFIFPSADIVSFGVIVWLCDSIRFNRYLCMHGRWYATIMNLYSPYTQLIDADLWHYKPLWCYRRPHLDAIRYEMHLPNEYTNEATVWANATLSASSNLLWQECNSDNRIRPGSFDLHNYSLQLLEFSPFGNSQLIYKYFGLMTFATIATQFNGTCIFVSMFCDIWHSCAP